MSERDQHNWEERREQLSALLDNELPAAERAELEAHLQSCAACRAELESLRRASALLRALPQPALPRSFLLPTEPAAQPAAGEQAERPRPAQEQPATPAPAHPAPIPLGPARSARLRRSAQVVRWLSTVAAVLGLLLLCGSVLSMVHLPRGGTSTASAPNSYYQNTPTQSGGTALGTTPPTESTAKSTSTQDRATPIAKTPNPGATATSGPFDGGTPIATRTNQGTGSGSGFPLSTPELGLLLLGVGVVGLIVAAILRRR